MKLDRINRIYEISSPSAMLGTVLSLSKGSNQNKRVTPNSVNSVKNPLLTRFSVNSVPLWLNPFLPNPILVSATPS